MGCVLSRLRLCPRKNQRYRSNTDEYSLWDSDVEFGFTVDEKVMYYDPADAV